MTLLDMLPRPTISSSLDCARGEPKFCGDWARRPSIGSNGPNNLICEFGTTHSFALDSGSMNKLIGLVFFSCSPSKVVQYIVQRVSVCMATLMCWRWFWAFESLKHHNMDQTHLCLTFFGEIYSRVSFQERVRRSDFARNSSGLDVFVVDFSLNRAHSSEIRNFVEALKTNYRAPCFGIVHFAIHMMVMHRSYQIRRTYG